MHTAKPPIHPPTSQSTPVCAQEPRTNHLPIEQLLSQCSRAESEHQT